MRKSPCCASLGPGYRRPPRLVIAVLVLPRPNQQPFSREEREENAQVLDVHLQQVPLGVEFCVLRRGGVDLGEEVGEGLLELGDVAARSG